MSRVDTLQHRFVDGFPDVLDAGVLYIALEFATMSHLCCCGCDHEVVTPLSPKDWRMTFDGESVSVQPSIGSWSLPCRSHYVIRNGRIQWAGQWTAEQIQRGRERNLVAKRGPDPDEPPQQAPAIDEQADQHKAPEVRELGLVSRLRRWFSR